MTLRPYQSAALDAVGEAFTSGREAVLLVAPTGAGKTRIGLAAAARAIARGKRAVWLAHRQELIEQTYDAATSLGIEAGIISSVQSRPVRPAPLQIAMLQTLLARSLRPEADLAICDEAHHLAADEYSNVVSGYRYRLGLTATPERADGRGLSALFDHMHVVASIRELTAAGHLVPCRVIGPDRALESGQLAQHPVAAYRAHCGDRPTIVFAPDIARAEEWAGELGAVVVHSKMRSEDRTAAVDAFRDGTARVLVNVNVLTEGFDAPSTSACILARGCGSPGMYLQIVGRILRPAPGKTDALLVDLRGVSHVHGAPDAEREFSLFGKPIRLKDDLKFCACCGTSITEYPCSSCGYAPDTVDGVEIKITGDAMRAIRFAAKRREDDQTRADTLTRWLQNARELGYKPGWAFAKYRAVYGSQPSQAIRALCSGRRAA